MAIKPILFNTEMVRAILDGKKSCTRRLVKPQPQGYFEVNENPVYIYDTDWNQGKITPPYQPGDILYVRETWERFECWNCEGDERGNCPKEPQKSVFDKTCGCYMYRATDEIYGDARWHPSIHMPKEAARIWLKVTDVRLERLQEIPGEDLIKEGIDLFQSNYVRVAFDKFTNIWNYTIKKSDLNCYGWDANPWVWVIEFERCKKPKGEN